MTEDEHPDDFDRRFRGSLTDHRAKLDALSPEKREEVESKLRETFVAHEKERMEYLNRSDGSFSFEVFEAMHEKQESEVKQHVDKAHEAHIADEKLRAQIKAKSRQGRDRDDGRER